MRSILVLGALACISVLLLLPLACSRQSEAQDRIEDLERRVNVLEALILKPNLEEKKAVLEFVAAGEKALQFFQKVLDQERKWIWKVYEKGQDSPEQRSEADKLIAESYPGTHETLSSLEEIYAPGRARQVKKNLLALGDALSDALVAIGLLRLPPVSFWEKAGEISRDLWDLEKEAEEIRRDLIDLRLESTRP